MVTVTYIMVNFFKISHMDKVFIGTPPMENYLKGNGLKINKLALVLKRGKTVLVTKENINKDRKADKEYLNGRMDVYIKDNFLTIICMAKVYISGLMEDLMKVNGRIIKWMAKEYLNGQMVENISVNT